MSRKRQALGAILVVALGGGIVWLVNRSPSVEAKAREYTESLREGDWGHIYDMAPMKERQAQPWKREQFVTMMRALDKDRRFSRVDIKLEPIEGSLSSMRSFTFKAANDREGSSMVVSFYRDVDTWRPSLFYVPISLARLNNVQTSARAKAIMDACHAAKIDRLVRLQGSIAMEIDRIPDFLAGKIQWAGLSFVPCNNRLCAAIRRNT